MQAGNARKVRRVRSSDGSTWETTAQNAGEYVFTPVFMTYFVLCVLLYAMLVQPSAEMNLPRVAEFLLWSALLMSSLLWLVLSISLNVYAVDRGYVSVIFTPFILLPLIAINVYTSGFIIRQFGTGLASVYGSEAEIIFRNTVVFICFDIIHSRFVAPQHPSYVRPDQPGGLTMNRPGPGADPTSPDPSMVGYSKTMMVQANPVSTGGRNGDREDEPENASLPEKPRSVEIGKEVFDAHSVLWMKSEDHYLNVQLARKTKMIRGKFRDAVDALGEDLGVQINRSVWVAYSAIRKIEEPSNGTFAVSVSDGTSFRVASTRGIMVQRGFEQYRARLEDVT